MKIFAVMVKCVYLPCSFQVLIHGVPSGSNIRRFFYYICYMETTYTEAYKEAAENMERSLKSYEKEMDRAFMRGIFCDYLPNPTDACNAKPLPFSVLATNLADKQL